MNTAKNNIGCVQHTVGISGLCVSVSFTKTEVHINVGGHRFRSTTEEYVQHTVTFSFHCIFFFCINWYLLITLYLVCKVLKKIFLRTDWLCSFLTLSMSHSVQSVPPGSYLQYVLCRPPSSSCSCCCRETAATILI